MPSAAAADRSARAAPRLLHVFPTFVPAGRETRSAMLMNELSVGWRHALVAIDGRLSARELLRRPEEVATIEAPAARGALAALRAWRALLARERPDLVLTYNWGAFDALLAARSLRLPVVHHEDGFNADEAARQLPRRLWTRRVLLRGVHLVVPSLKLAGIARESWRLAPGLVHHIDNGVELARHSPRDGAPELRRRLGIPLDAPVVGWLGHLRPVKNPLRFLSAMARVDPELRAWALVVGDGPERPACEAFAARTHTLAGRVVFAGHQSDPREHLRAMDAFCISSDSEQMPIALVEAMATALPTASTDVGDVRGMLGTHQEAQVVPLAEHETAWPLAEAIQGLLADPALRARLGARNRELALERYGLEAMVRAHEAVWRAALARR
jgi:glycosyltransferase involved in cell wall biosynthesis